MRASVRRTPDRGPSLAERGTSNSATGTPSARAEFLRAYSDDSSASPRGVLPPFRPFATSIADSSAVS